MRGGRSKKADSNTKTSYEAVNSRRQWRPGVAGTPWLGFAALLTAICSIFVCIGILIGSDGVLISEWRFSPSVYLAIASTVANIALTFALAEGVKTTWWRTALQGSTLGQLHHIHHFGSNVLPALVAGRQFNFIALACILVTVAPINGPLLQRASRVSSTEVVSKRLIKVAASPEVLGSTAYVSGRTAVVSMYSKYFTPIARDWAVQRTISMNKTGCSGVCNGTLRGAGFAINCTSNTQSFNMTPPWKGMTQLPENWPDIAPDAQYFGITVDFATIYYPFNISVLFKNTTACVGQVQIRNCTLSPATVDFPVSIDGTGQTISLAQGTTIFDDKLVHTVIDDSEPFDGFTSRFGGMYTALQDRFVSSVSLGADPVKVDIASSLGSASFQYISFPVSFNESSGEIPSSNCTMSFTDPLPDVLQAARELSFRVAIATANESNTQSIQVTEQTSAPRYRSSWLFLGLALLGTLLPVTVVSATFYGYWQIGRPVSLSPIETAKAFNAPGLRSRDSNGTARELINELGYLRVRYGAVHSEDCVSSRKVDSGGSEVHSDGALQATEAVLRDGVEVEDTVTRKSHSREIKRKPVPSGAQVQMKSEDGNDVRKAEDIEDATRVKLQLDDPGRVIKPMRGWVFHG